MSEFQNQGLAEITSLERRVHALQEELSKYKSEAEKWAPRVGSEVRLNEETAHITLAFGGKNMTARVSKTALVTSDLASLTVAVVQTLSPLLEERLRAVIEPEVQKLMSNISSVSSAGKW